MPPGVKIFEVPLLNNLSLTDTFGMNSNVLDGGIKLGELTQDSMSVIDGVNEYSDSGSFLNGAVTAAENIIPYGSSLKNLSSGDFNNAAQSGVIEFIGNIGCVKGAAALAKTFKNHYAAAAGCVLGTVVSEQAINQTIDNVKNLNADNEAYINGYVGRTSGPSRFMKDALEI
jgi:hypothetical protein